MTDIVEQLREDAPLSDTYALMNEAADEIENLRSILQGVEAKLAFGKSQAASARDALNIAIEYILDAQAIART